MKVSVVIPTLNGGKDLVSCAQSLASQNFCYQWELIIIDSNSDDNSLSEVEKILHERSVDINIVKIDRKDFQHGGSRNKAISVAKGEIICLLTQDAIPRDDMWLQELINPFFEEQDIVGTFGRHKPHQHHPRLLSKNLKHHFDYMSSMRIRKIDDLDFYQKNEQHRQFLHFFSNNNSALRRDEWLSCPFQSVEFGEDQLWAKDVLEKGKKLAYCDKAVVEHSHNYSLFSVFKRAKIEKRYYKKYFGYDLKTPKKKLVYIIFSLLFNDLKWLMKEGYLNPSELICSLRVNIGSQIAYCFCKDK